MKDLSKANVVNRVIEDIKKSAKSCIVGGDPITENSANKDPGRVDVEKKNREDIEEDAKPSIVVENPIAENSAMEDLVVENPGIEEK